MYISCLFEFFDDIKKGCLSHGIPIVGKTIIIDNIWRIVFYRANSNNMHGTAGVNRILFYIPEQDKLYLKQIFQSISSIIFGWTASFLDGIEQYNYANLL